jgi:hypothetical protein
MTAESLIKDKLSLAKTLSSRIDNSACKQNIDFALYIIDSCESDLKTQVDESKLFTLFLSQL